MKYLTERDFFEVGLEKNIDTNKIFIFCAIRRCIYYEFFPTTFFKIYELYKDLPTPLVVYMLPSTEKNSTYFTNDYRIGFNGDDVQFYRINL